MLFATAGPATGQTVAPAGYESHLPWPSELDDRTVAPATWLDAEGPHLDHAAVALDDHCQAADCQHRFEWEVLGRTYYQNDQRIEFTGQEATFGAEGVLRGAYTRWVGDWETRIVGEFFLNQPFERNLLADTPERRSYLANFQIDPLEIQQLYISGRSGDWQVALGKIPTPFGRTYFPIFRNDYSDAPFLRTESILWRETGALVQWNPQGWVAAAALTNGGDDRDTNSSKAGIARLGVEGEGFAFGGSIKVQDGTGSEGQKKYRSHYGLDGMIQSGPFRLSGEVIYDLYGYRHAIDPNTITWGRSIYYRDQNFIAAEPIHGLGYYLNLDYQGDFWTVMLNYGEFYPQQIGDPRHDVTTRRGIIKGAYRLERNCELFGMYLVENDLAGAQDGRTRRGSDLLFGVQFGL